jgi:hypothetical protein
MSRHGLNDMGGDIGPGRTSAKPRLSIAPCANLC